MKVSVPSGARARITVRPDDPAPYVVTVACADLGAALVLARRLDPTSRRHHEPSTATKLTHCLVRLMRQGVGATDLVRHVRSLNGAMAAPLRDDILDDLMLAVARRHLHPAPARPEERA